MLSTEYTVQTGLSFLPSLPGVRCSLALQLLSTLGHLRNNSSLAAGACKRARAAASMQGDPASARVAVRCPVLSHYAPAPTLHGEDVCGPQTLSDLQPTTVAKRVL